MSDFKTHLSRDPVMKVLITKHNLIDRSPDQANLFLDLLETVTSQQLSIKAADTIFKRFLNLFDTLTPNPDQVVSVSIEQLRTVGLSGSKSTYIQNIAQAIKEGSLNLDPNYLNDLTDEQIIDQLTSIKGLGPWSAQMFLMFSLKRPDVFAIGDLGIRTAISRHYQIDRTDTQKILALSESWRPYRTYACKYLWLSLDNT